MYMYTTKFSLSLRKANQVLDSNEVFCFSHNYTLYKNEQADLAKNCNICFESQWTWNVLTSFFSLLALTSWPLWATANHPWTISLMNGWQCASSELPWVE